MAKINLKLYDIDQCLYHSFQVTPDGFVPAQEWLIPTNQSFFDKQIAEIEEQAFDKVIVGYGTNRQDKFMNEAIELGGSMTPALPVIQSYLDSKVDCEVVLEPFLMSDLYGLGRHAGDNYIAILKKEYAGSTTENFNPAVIDHNKASLIYAHAHRVANLHPNDEIVIDFYDDNIRILDSLKDLFKKKSHWLPKNVKLRLHRYNGKLEDPKVITGTGEIDKAYKWSVRYFAAQASRQDSVKDGEALRNYHEKRKYKNSIYVSSPFSSPQAYAMNVTTESVQSFAENFESLRKKQFNIKSKGVSPLDAPAYTTATALYEAGLIPKTFLTESTRVKKTVPSIATIPASDDTGKETIEKTTDAEIKLQEIAIEKTTESSASIPYVASTQVEDEIDVDTFLQNSEALLKKTSVFLPIEEEISVAESVDAEIKLQEIAIEKTTESSASITYVASTQVEDEIDVDTFLQNAEALLKKTSVFLPIEEEISVAESVVAETKQEERIDPVASEADEKAARVKPIESNIDRALTSEEFEKIVAHTRKFISIIGENICVISEGSLQTKLKRIERLHNANSFLELIVKNKNSRNTVLAIISDFTELDLILNKENKQINNEKIQENCLIPEKPITERTNTVLTYLDLARVILTNDKAAPISRVGFSN